MERCCFSPWKSSSGTDTWTEAETCTEEPLGLQGPEADGGWTGEERGSQSIAGGREMRPKRRPGGTTVGLKTWEELGSHTHVMEPLEFHTVFKRIPGTHWKRWCTWRVQHGLAQSKRGSQWHQSHNVEPGEGWRCPGGHKTCYSKGAREEGGLMGNASMFYGEIQSGTAPASRLKVTTEPAHSLQPPSAKGRNWVTAGRGPSWAPPRETVFSQTHSNMLTEEKTTF